MAQTTNDDAKIQIRSNMMSFFNDVIGDSNFAHKFVHDNEQQQKNWVNAFGPILKREPQQTKNWGIFDCSITISFKISGVICN